MGAEAVGVLLVDDEPTIRRVLRSSLGLAGFAVHEASCGEAALKAFHQRASDLVLLDINMPGLDGFRTCLRIRDAAPAAGIVIMSVRGQEEDQIRAFRAGADDYLTKPFRFGELVARLRSLHRRLRSAEAQRPTVLHAGGLTLDVSTRKLLKAGQEVHLTPKEFDLLAYLMRHANTVIPGARLLQAIWGPEYGGELEYLRTYVRHLRTKIEAEPSQPRYLLTEPWYGYRFCDQPASGEGRRQT